MVRSLAAAAVLAVLASGCGSSTSAPPTTTFSTTSQGAPTTPISPAPTELTVFRSDGGPLRAEAVRVPHTLAVASAALGALDLGATVTVSNGTASVALERPTDAQVAEIVYTLTQFPPVERVDVGGRKGLTRADVVGFAPLILVEAPAAGATVTRAITVRGSASVFEATLVVELRRGAQVIEKQSVTASQGAPGRGAFQTTLHAPTAAGAYTVVAYSPSAADGSPQHEQDVPVTVTP